MDLFLTDHSLLEVKGQSSADSSYRQIFSVVISDSLGHQRFPVFDTVSVVILSGKIRLLKVNG